ncbi:hypothetical protein AB1Y20_022764 [Prymnesium parvum]|uniref:Prolyl 4-hydroxylase alpha subunit domain-containing protein n=1 Tax=Prymnesium parvum TaxID=97485 RepID=A0AB34JKM4_PRYPA
MAPPDLTDAFFAAQSLAEAGDLPAATLAFESIVRATAGCAPCPLTPRGLSSAPPPSLLSSLCLSSLAEAQIDAATQLGFPLLAEGTPAALRARELLLASRCNISATLSLALLSRDSGDGSLALSLWREAAALPAGGGADPHGWWRAFVGAPREACGAVARLHAALLLSQLGGHAEAAEELRRMGYAWRLAPEAWRSAAGKAGGGGGGGEKGGGGGGGGKEGKRKEKGGGRRGGGEERGGAENGGAKENGAARKGGEGAGGGVVEWHAAAVPRRVAAALRRAFAPHAPYWRETGYHDASAEKRYFTFYVDLTRPASAHASLIEQLIHHLRPLTRRDDLIGAEWWVHSRAAGRGIGHELHFDVEEAHMEATGEVVHPAVSSVVYLSDEGDPTIVLDQTLHGPLASHGWLVHPQYRAFMTFAGDRLHGVLPGEFASASAPLHCGAAAAQRLTLLVAWYDRRTRGQTRRGGGQCAVPRPTRRRRWPAMLSPPAEREEEEEEEEEGGGGEAAGGRGGVVRFAPAWERLAAAARRRGAREAAACEPPSLRQHFFLREEGEVRLRLEEEHGVEGSWAKGRRKRTRAGGGEAQ